MDNMNDLHEQINKPEGHDAGAATPEGGAALGDSLVKGSDGHSEKQMGPNEVMCKGLEVAILASRVALVGVNVGHALEVAVDLIFDALGQCLLLVLRPNYHSRSEGKGFAAVESYILKWAQCNFAFTFYRTHDCAADLFHHRVVGTAAKLCWG